MTIFGPMVRWLCGWPVWARNRYHPGDMNLYTDLLGDQLTIHPIQMGWEITIEVHLC